MPGQCNCCLALSGWVEMYELRRALPRLLTVGFGTCTSFLHPSTEHKGPIDARSST